MANGERCKTCRKNETEHEVSPDETCGLFESEVTHKQDCPILECNGDCDATIAERVWHAKCIEKRSRFAWFMSGPNLVWVDIGT